MRRSFTPRLFCCVQADGPQSWAAVGVEAASSGLRAEQAPRSRSMSCLSQTFFSLYNECPCQLDLICVFPKNEKSFKIIYSHCKKKKKLKKRSQPRKLSFNALSSLSPPTFSPPTPTQNCVFLTLAPSASPDRGGVRREG